MPMPKGAKEFKPILLAFSLGLGLTMTKNS